MRTVILLGSILLLAVTGCTSLKDARGPSEFCEVHHAFMRSIEVPGPKGELAVTHEYMEAQARFFPHAYLDYAPDARHRWMIYVCPDCVQAKAVWVKQHPDAVPK